MEEWWKLDVFGPEFGYFDILFFKFVKIFVFAEKREKANERRCREKHHRQKHYFDDHLYHIDNHMRRFNNSPDILHDLGKNSRVKELFYAL